MIHIKTYKLFENKSRPVVSFDFDGVLHKSVEGLNPINFDQPDTWEPFEKMFGVMREEAKNNDIIIVTARDGWMEDHVREFIDLHDLPVKRLYMTNDGPKLPVLHKTGAIRHYDDNPKLAAELKANRIEFVLVDPKTDDYKLMESAEPKVWYHGTDREFTKFESMPGDKGSSVLGIWISDDKDFAKMFGDKVIEVTAEYKNPKVITQDEWDEIRSSHAKDKKFFDAMKKDLINKGYDALYIKERETKFAGQVVRDPNIVAVFDPSNIKIK